MIRKLNKEFIIKKSKWRKIMRQTRALKANVTCDVKNFMIK